MGDIISREAAVQALEVSNVHHGIISALQENLRDLPAIDAVSVVRCRDCENWDTSWEPNYAGENEYYCPILDHVCSQDFYCGYGKHKDGGRYERPI